jgi:hypothetical protein
MQVPKKSDSDNFMIGNSSEYVGNGIEGCSHKLPLSGYFDETIQLLELMKI